MQADYYHSPADVAVGIGLGLMCGAFGYLAFYPLPLLAHGAFALDRLRGGTAEGGSSSGGAESCGHVGEEGSGERDAMIPTNAENV